MYALQFWTDTVLKAYETWVHCLHKQWRRKMFWDRGADERGRVAADSVSTRSANFFGRLIFKYDFSSSRSILKIMHKHHSCFGSSLVSSGYKGSSTTRCVLVTWLANARPAKFTCTSHPPLNYLFCRALFVFNVSAIVGQSWKNSLGAAGSSLNRFPMVRHGISIMCSWHVTLTVNVLEYASSPGP